MWGGEWEGRVGFGMMRNRTFPLINVGSDITGKIWLSVEPISFIVSFIVVLSSGQFQKRKDGKINHN